jgi:hypothetical protein
VATKTSTEAPTWMQAREAVVITVGARAPVYRTAIVRNRHTGQLDEVELNEFAPIDPGDEGRWYVFKRGEKVLSDHEAVITSPGSFIPLVVPPGD